MAYTKSLVDLSLNMINNQSYQAIIKDNDQDYIFHLKVAFWLDRKQDNLKFRSKKYL